MTGFLGNLFFSDGFFAIPFLAVLCKVFFFAGFFLTDLFVRAFVTVFFFAGFLGVVAGRGVVPEDASPPTAAESQKRNSGDFMSAPLM